MALALDASTPAFVTGTTNPATTASFTPPSGALLFAVCEADESNTFSVAGGSLTWTSVGVNINQAGQGSLAVFWAYATVSPGSMTVASTRTGSFTANALKVLVFTGAETTFGGAKITGLTATVNITTTRDNSWVWAGHIEEGGGADPAATGCAFNDAEVTFGGIGGGILKRTATTPTSGTVVNIGVSSSTLPAILAFEVRESSTSTVVAGRTSTAWHPGRGPNRMARFYTPPRSTATTAAGVTLGDTALGVLLGVPTDSIQVGVALTDQTGAVAAGTPSGAIANDLVLQDAATPSRAGTVSGEQAVNSLAIADPTAAGSRAAGAADSAAVGIVLADVPDTGRAASATNTVAVGVVVQDSLGGARNAGTSDTVAVGAVLADITGGGRVAGTFGETATGALVLTDTPGASRTAGRSDTVTYDLVGTDTVGAARATATVGTLAASLVLADSVAPVRAGTPLGETATSALVVLDPGAGHQRAGTPRGETILQGTALIDAAAGAVRAAGRTETITNTVTLTDAAGSARGSGTTDAARVSLVLVDVIGHSYSRSTQDVLVAAGPVTRGAMEPTARPVATATPMERTTPVMEPRARSNATMGGE